MVVGAIDFASLLSSGFSGTEVAYLAHLGGIAVGYIALKSHAYFKLKQITNKMKKKNTSSLRLVIDNDKNDKDDNPKYWN